MIFAQTLEVMDENEENIVTDEATPETLKGQRGKKTIFKKRDIAFTYFCNGISKGDIAKKLNVVPQTISLWAADDQWEERRKVQITNPIQLKKLCFEEANKVARGLKSNIDIDTLRKYVLILKDLEDEVTLEKAVACEIDFLEFCRNNGISEKGMIFIAKWQKLYINSFLNAN